MSKRQERLERIRAAEREYQAATVAVGLLTDQLRTDPAYLKPADLRCRDAESLADHLEATFLLRLYAEFESGLRDAWANAFHRPTHPPMRNLMEAVAARCHVPQDWLDDAQEVRSYRNALVHEEATVARIISLSEARRRLCSFLSCLPLDW